MTTNEASRGASPDMLTAEHFEPHVGKTFHFKSASYALVLDRVNLDGAPHAGGRRPFTLIFREPKSREYLPEGLYECTFEGGAGVTLYVAPIHSPGPDHQDYQAVFN